MSGGLAPSKSTVYVGNLPYSLTNSDLHKVFEKYGKVVKVTVLKDREKRRSQGVAFVLFLRKEDAHACVQALSGRQMFGRTLKASIAKDNGRAAEFIRRRNYPDKSRCYECGEEGHISYRCPKNALGNREPPKKVKKKNKNKVTGIQEEMSEDESDSDETEDPKMDSLGAAIKYQQMKMEEEEYRYKVLTGNYKSSSSSSVNELHKKKIRQSSYFSDEEDTDE